MDAQYAAEAACPKGQAKFTEKEARQMSGLLGKDKSVRRGRLDLVVRETDCRCGMARL